MQNTNKKTEWNAISINGLMERPHKRQLTKTVFFYIKNLNMCLRNIYQGQKDTEQIHGKYRSEKTHILAYFPLCICPLLLYVTQMTSSCTLASIE